MTKKNALAKKERDTREKLATQPKQLKTKRSGNQIIKPPITPLPMTEQLTVPPPYIWNRIEKVLNEQDKIKSAKSAIFYPYTKTKKQAHPLFAAMGITLMLCFIIIGF